MSENKENPWGEIFDKVMDAFKDQENEKKAEASAPSFDIHRFIDELKDKNIPVENIIKLIANEASKRGNNSENLGINQIGDSTSEIGEKVNNIISEITGQKNFKFENLPVGELIKIAKSFNNGKED